MKARRLLLAAVVLLATAACSRSEARPSGVTERWLQAVSEQGRTGLLEDATERADKLAERTATDRVRPDDAEEDERTFSDLEVGKAIVDVDQARVPFRVTARLRGGDKREQKATAILVNRHAEWVVVDIAPRLPGERVPSEGGARPARANLGHWLLAIGLSLVLTALSIFLVERQPTSTANAGKG